jgi:hypothetical protein
MTTNAKQLIERERQTHSGYLDLGRCDLTEMPDLSDLDWLEILILSNKWGEIGNNKNGSKAKIRATLIDSHTPAQIISPQD